MIVSDLEHLREQVVMTPNMETALDFLLESGQQEHPAGRLTVDGERVFVEVQAYDTIDGVRSSSRGIASTSIFSIWSMARK